MNACFPLRRLVRIYAYCLYTITYVCAPVCMCVQMFARVRFPVASHTLNFAKSLPLPAPLV